MEGSKVAVLDTLLDNVDVAGHKLDHVPGHACLEQKFVCEIVGVHGHGAGFPQCHPAEDGRHGHEVAADCGKVERRDGERESLNGAELDPVDGLGHDSHGLLLVSVVDNLD